MHSVGGRGVVVRPLLLSATASVRDLYSNDSLGDNPALQTKQGNSASLVLCYARNDEIPIQDR